MWGNSSSVTFDWNLHENKNKTGDQIDVITHLEKKSHKVIEIKRVRRWAAKWKDRLEKITQSKVDVLQPRNSNAETTKKPYRRGTNGAIYKEDMISRKRAGIHRSRYVAFDYVEPRQNPKSQVCRQDFKICPSTLLCDEIVCLHAK